MKQLFTILITTVLLAGCAGNDNKDQENSTPESGTDNTEAASIIENATFVDLDGNEVTLEDYHGKVVLIDFWESWCGPCLQVFPSMQKLREEFPDNFEILAVTLGMSEGPEEARTFKENHEYDFNYLYDKFKVSENLGIYSIPHKVFIGPDGKMIKQEIGSKGRQGDYEGAKSVILEYME